jgi:hypothetical protein
MLMVLHPRRHEARAPLSDVGRSAWPRHEARPVVRPGHEGIPHLVLLPRLFVEPEEHLSRSTMRAVTIVIAVIVVLTMVLGLLPFAVR